jgi:hypothetical protein
MSEFNRKLEQRLAQRNVEQAYENLYNAQAYYNRLLQGQDAQNMMASYGIGEAPSYSDVQNYQMRCGGKPKAAWGDFFRRGKTEQAPRPMPLPRPTVDLVPGVREQVTEKVSPTVKSPTFNTEAPFYFTPTPYNVRKWQGRDMEATKNAYTQVYGYHPDDDAWAKGLALAQAGIRDPEVDALLPRRVRNRSVGYMMMNSNPNYFNKPEDATIVDDGTKPTDDNVATEQTEGTDEAEITTNPIQSTTQETTPVTTTTQTSATSKSKTSQPASKKVHNQHNITQSEAQRIAEEAAKKQGSSMEITSQGYKRVPYEQYAKLPGDIYGLSGKTSAYYPGARYALQIDENGKERKLYVPYIEMSRYFGVPYEQIERDVQSGKIYNPDDIRGAEEWAKKHPGEFYYVNPTLLGSKGWYDYSKGRPISKGYTLKGYAYGGDPYQRLPYNPNDTIRFRTERLPLKKGQNIKDYNNPFQPL